MGKIIEYNGAKYHINPKDIKAGGWNDYYNAKDKINIFYKNKVNYDCYSVMKGDIYDLLKKQPTQKQVDRALIWGTGYDGENSIYSIKSGGEAAGEYYQSVLRYDYNGGMYDAVVNKPIMVKYSTNFEDVLITHKEFCDIYELLASKKEKNNLKEDSIYAAISYYYRNAKTDEDKAICVNQILRVNLDLGIEIVSDIRNEQFRDKAMELLSKLQAIKDNK